MLRNVKRMVVRKGEENMELSEKLAVNLKEIMKQKNISIPELAKKSGVSEATIGNMRNNNFAPKIGNISKVAKALEVKAITLLL